MRPNLSILSKKSKETDRVTDIASYSRALSLLDSRYVNETDYLKISENLNMNNKKIINCEDGEDDNDVCTIKNLTVYYKKGNPIKLEHSCSIDMNNNKITNCREGVDENDVCTMKNIRNLSISITHFNTDVNMNNNRLTFLSDGIALNDAVNVKQLIDSRRGSRVENFYSKSGRLTFNRYGVSVIYKSPTDCVAVGVLLISKGSLYVQEVTIIKGEYTLFIPPATDESLYTNKDYYFYYWKSNFVTEPNSPGLEVSQEEFNHLHQG